MTGGQQNKLVTKYTYDNDSLSLSLSLSLSVEIEIMKSTPKFRIQQKCLPNIGNHAKNNTQIANDINANFPTPTFAEQPYEPVEVETYQPPTNTKEHTRNKTPNHLQSNHMNLQESDLPNPTHLLP